MSHIDDTIRKALRAEDDDLLRDLAEPGMLKQAIDSLRGSSRWLRAMAIIFTLSFFGLQIWSAIMFFRATDLQHMIAWATGFLFCGLAVAMLKMWFWMQMDKYVVLREIKRLELQVATLAQRRDS